MAHPCGTSGPRDLLHPQAAEKGSLSGQARGVPDESQQWPQGPPSAERAALRRGIVQHVKRLLVTATSVYFLFAVIGRFVEGMGAVRCGCRPDCWCQKPVLSTFRWVFPAGHSFDAEAS